LRKGNKQMIYKSNINESFRVSNNRVIK